MLFRSSLKVKDQRIEYTLERKKIKNCYIAIKDGQVQVRVPMKTSQEAIQEILLKRAKWILQNVKKQSKKAPKKYVDGEIFKVLGKELVLKISYEKVPNPKCKVRISPIKSDVTN